MHHDPRSDQQLIAIANHGGEAGRQAFEAIYYRYRDWVVSLAYRYTHNRDTALDVMQETFMYLMRKFPGFQLTVQFKTFLYPVVKNLSIAANKKSRRFGGENLLSQAEPAAEAECTDEDLSHVLSQLSEDHRETVVLRFVDGLSVEEIAHAMDVPSGTVKSRLHHALRQLRADPQVKAHFDPCG